MTDVEIRIENPLSEQKTLESEKEGNEHGIGIRRVKKSRISSMERLRLSKRDVS